MEAFQAHVQEDKSALEKDQEGPGPVRDGQRIHEHRQDRARREGQDESGDQGSVEGHDLLCARAILRRNRIFELEQGEEDPDEEIGTEGQKLFRNVIVHIHPAMNQYRIKA